MVEKRLLIREFVAALRRGDTERARHVKEAAWVLHRQDPMDEAGLRTVRAIYDIESTIPLGQQTDEENP